MRRKLGWKGYNPKSCLTPCVSPQICMKYGRQRWKLRGRIESSGKQVWDSEETVFLPLLTEFLSIKVISLTGSVRQLVPMNLLSCGLLSPYGPVNVTL